MRQVKVFITLRSAVGGGCPIMSNELDTSRQTVHYFIQGGVFFASTSCRPGSTFSDVYRAASLIRCSNSAWTSRLSRCIGKPARLLRLISMRYTVLLLLLLFI